MYRRKLAPEYDEYGHAVNYVPAYMKSTKTTNETVKVEVRSNGESIKHELAPEWLKREDEGAQALLVEPCEDDSYSAEPESGSNSFYLTKDNMKMSKRQLMYFAADLTHQYMDVVQNTARQEQKVDQLMSVLNSMVKQGQGPKSHKIRSVASASASETYLGSSPPGSVSVSVATDSQINASLVAEKHSCNGPISIVSTLDTSDSNTKTLGSYSNSNIDSRSAISKQEQTLTDTDVVGDGLTHHIHKTPESSASSLKIIAPKTVRQLSDKEQPQEKPERKFSSSLEDSAIKMQESRKCISVGSSSMGDISSASISTRKTQQSIAPVPPVVHENGNTKKKPAMQYYAPPLPKCPKSPILPPQTKAKMIDKKWLERSARVALAAKAHTHKASQPTPRAVAPIAGTRQLQIEFYVDHRSHNGAGVLVINELRRKTVYHTHYAPATLLVASTGGNDNTYANSSLAISNCAIGLRSFKEYFKKGDQIRLHCDDKKITDAHFQPTVNLEIAAQEVSKIIGCDIMLFYRHIPSMGILHDNKQMLAASYLAGGQRRDGIRILEEAIGATRGS